MDDRTRNELWKKEMEKRNKGNRIMLLGILFIALSVDVQVRYMEVPDVPSSWISLALSVIGVITGIVGFFFDKDW